MKSPAFLQRVWHWLHLFEEGLLLFIFIGMMGIAVAQIVLRNVFHTGIEWSDVFLRSAVLWIALIGAMIASRTGNHVQIDVVRRFMPEWLQRWGARITSAATMLVAALFSWHGVRFAYLEWQDQTMAIGVVPSWVVVSIIPFGFAMIAIRYLILTVNPRPMVNE